MRINFSTQTDNTYKIPTFKANRRIVCDESGKMLYKTTSYMFRPDLNWDSFVKLLQEKYANTKQVNIINHACSNGAEPFSLVIKLISILGEKAQKFFPIKAKDIDEENIRRARNGYIGIHNDDMYNMNEQMQGNIGKFLNYVPSRAMNDDLGVQPIMQVRENIEFKRSDIFNDIDELPESNTVLLCRNFWPYLDTTKQELLAQKLAQKLDKTSLVAVGNFDSECNIDKLLTKNGFIPTNVENVYTKH